MVQKQNGLTCMWFYLSQIIHLLFEPHQLACASAIGVRLVKGIIFGFLEKNV